MTDIDQTAPVAPVHQQRFPCDRCGSDMRFDPAGQLLICDYCGNTQAVGDTGAAPAALRELDFRSAVSDQLPATEMAETRVITCPNCGATFEFDAKIHAAVCPFCATPFVADTGMQRQIKPRGVLPFALDEKAARGALTDWLGSLWFAPGGVQDYARKGRTMSGIYVPYWTFDADTKSTYSGARGTHYYETRTVTRNGKTEQVRVQKTSWSATSGRVARFFDDVLVLASRSLPKRYTDALQPWDLSAMQPYRDAYLAGFRAEGYQVELQDAFTEARGYMDAMILRDVRFDIGGDEQRVDYVKTDIGALTFKHVLLPVWLAAYKYRGRTFRFVVNGRTGRVQGERPYSAWKIGFAVVIGLIIAAAVGYVYALNQ